MRRATHTIRVLLTSACLTGVAGAVEYSVSSASEITSALSSIAPGDVLVMTNGDWTDQYIKFKGNGQAGLPITLRAQTPGHVVLNGISRLEIGGSYLVVEGLRFEGGALGDGDHVVRFTSGGTNASHCTLRDTAIVDYNPADRYTRYFWVSLYGQYNTVEHCRFENQDHSGVTVCVWGDWPNHHVIRYNHFVDRPVGPDNGWESIRIGTSDFVDDSSETTVEYNLFQRADGEIEAVSNKTGNNVYRYNTFRECKATLTLRHGFAAQVYGNFFFGEGATGSGGIRVIGPGHRIWNNYFEGLLGRTEGIIALEAGEPDGPASGYAPVTDVVIANNTIVDCNDPAFILDRGLDSTRTVLPSGVTIVGNLVSNHSESVATGANPNITWTDNLAYASGLGTASGSGVTLLGADPLSTAADGLQRPQAGGPADGTLASLDLHVTDDMDGDARSLPADVGADEISTAQPMRRPLTPDEVGPSWWNASQGDGPDPALGVVIEAEDADEILDPDGDGSVYMVTQVAGASNGAVIEAPPGSRTDLATGPHETIAVYRVTPPAPGDYTAYFLARGFSTSTDSFFAPAAFDTDPDVNTSTSTTGLFNWEVGATLAYTSGEAELRVGRREGGNQIDAIILYPDPDLTSPDLDYLLSVGPAEPCAPDFDLNGSLDFFDALAYLRLYDAGDPSADLNQNGTINSFDLFRYLNDFLAGCP
ncbi:MAG: hypothetical protein H6810_10980 [Phycisphaeraceae bacterium]|nr:MAG: hypothetical protein H6810_10980 [Phycisphaeraceae bacterium]